MRETEWKKSYLFGVKMMMNLEKEEEEEVEEEVEEVKEVEEVEEERRKRRKRRRLELYCKKKKEKGGWFRQKVK